MMPQSQLSRLGLFDAKVPRYTSYPTAVQFATDVQGAQLEQWLGDVDRDSAISMYLHIPFCKRLCWFCACRTQGVTTDAPVQSYLGTLRREIAMVAAAMPDGITLNRLHWGGGSPTILPAADIERLALTIRDLLPHADDIEFCVEIDPGEVDDLRLDALRDAGMNRASIGVQDFDRKVQATIGREQSFEITQKVTRALRRRGIHSLNIDLLYGLPHQTVSGIKETAQKVTALNPDRLALYGYAHVPWMARRQTMIPEQHLPDAGLRLDLSETAREVFEAAGYVAVGIDHFAKPGDGLAQARNLGQLRRNFQGYTDDRSRVLVGVGASAISRFPQGYVQNISATSAYLK
ncbi:MAG: oxygen-independent coproporphyrinogen III oxidase, partial [Paracoccaceae bacterium]